MLWLRRDSGFTGESFPADSGIVAFAATVVANGVFVTCGIRVFFGSASTASSSHELVKPFDNLGLIGGTLKELVNIGSVNGKGRSVNVHGVRIME